MMGKQFTKRAGITLAAALTLGMLSSILQNVQTVTVASAASIQFTDFKSSHWAYDAVQKAVSKGYVDGYANETFKPDVSVTRAEFTKMVVAAMELNEPNDSGKWYVPYVNSATKAGLYANADFFSQQAITTMNEWVRQHQDLVLEVKAEA